MPALPPHPFSFTPAEASAALWAVAATRFLVEHGGRDRDPEAAATAAPCPAYRGW
jgi:hypothetical protein